MLAGELLPRSGPCPHAARSAPGCKCQVLALHSGSQAWPHRPPAEGRALGFRSSLRTRRFSNPIPERRDSHSGLCWQSLEWPRGVLRVKLEGEANRISLLSTPAGPRRQRAGSGLLGFPGVMRETRNPQLEYSQTVGRREVPAVGVGFPRVQNVAPLAPVTDGVGTQPPFSLASRVFGVCVVSRGGGKFQHLCCCALWSLEGNLDLGSVFTSGHLLYQGMSAVGVIEAGWKVTREGRVRKPGS